LRFVGAPGDANNLTIGERGGVLRALEDGERLTVGPRCRAGADAYSATCPLGTISGLQIDLGGLGSDLKLLTPLPAVVRGGPQDNQIVAGPGTETIDAGGGANVVIIGAAGRHLVHVGAGENVISYAWQLDPRGNLVPRRSGARVVLGRRNASGSAGSQDSLLGHYTEVDGSASGNDTIDTRDGTAQTIVCGTGNDRVWIDPFDTPTMSCRTVHVAPAAHGRAMRAALLPFPFGGAPRARGTVVEDSAIPVAHGVAAIQVTCPVPIGLLEIFGPGCTGTLALGDAHGTLATRRVALARGRALAWHVALPPALQRAGQVLYAEARARNGATRVSRFAIRR
jgi:hypothetical protein